MLARLVLNSWLQVIPFAKYWDYRCEPLHPAVFFYFPFWDAFSQCPATMKAHRDQRPSISDLCTCPCQWAAVPSNLDISEDGQLSPSHQTPETSEHWSISRPPTQTARLFLPVPCIPLVPRNYKHFSRRT